MDDRKSKLKPENLNKMAFLSFLDKQGICFLYSKGFFDFITGFYLIKIFVFTFQSFYSVLFSEFSFIYTIFFV